MPLSLLAIPMLAGDRPVGSLILHDYDKEDAYTAIHVELLSTLTSPWAWRRTPKDSSTRRNSALKRG